MSLYENVCRSLFEAHKLLFSFKMTINILFGKEEMDASELRFLLAGPSGEIKIEKNPTDLEKWPIVIAVSCFYSAKDLFAHSTFGKWCWTYSF